MVTITYMYSYCLDNLKEKGSFYAQGMTDLVAPLLVVIDDGKCVDYGLCTC